MARAFVRTSSQYATTTLPGESSQLSIGYILRHSIVPSGPSFPNRHSIIGRTNSTGTQANYYILHTSAGISFGFTHADNAFNEFTAPFTWDTTNDHDVLINFDWSNDAFEVWVDGASLTVSVAQGSFSNSPQVSTGGTDQIGRYGSGSEYTNMAKFAELTIWQGVRMTQADANMWHARFVNKVRPSAVTRRWPFLSGSSPEIEVRNSFGATLVNSPAVADHPRVLGLRSRRTLSQTVVGGSTTFNLEGVTWGYSQNNIKRNFQFHASGVTHTWTTNDVSIGASTNVSLASSAWQWATNTIKKNFQFHLSGTSWNWTTTSPQVQKAIDLASSTWQWTTNAITKTVNFKPILDAALWRWSANAFVAFQLPYHLIRSLTRPLYRAIVKKITRNST